MEEELKEYVADDRCDSCFFRNFCETCSLPNCEGEDYVPL